LSIEPAHADGQVVRTNPSTIRVLSIGGSMADDFAGTHSVGVRMAFRQTVVAMAAGRGSPASLAEKSILTPAEIAG